LSYKITELVDGSIGGGESIR